MSLADQPWCTGDDPLPVDWVVWRHHWDSWRNQHGHTLRRTSRPAGYPAEKNMLADEVLGWFVCPNGVVELSEVTFRIYELERFVGYAFDPHRTGATGVVKTFAELEEVLGLAGGCVVDPA